jgi:DNA-binding IclR family transcriptional regulator
LQLHKSTVSRLLSTLEAGGFVQQDPRNGRYRLGLQLAALGGLALTQYDIGDVARPLLQEMATRAGETTTLSVLDGDAVVNIDQVLGPQPVKHIGWIGRRMPLYCTAAGKPLLAHLPAESVDRLLDRPLERFTARTITSPAQIRREIEDIRTRGYAVGHEEYEAELNAPRRAIVAAGEKREERGYAVRRSPPALTPVRATSRPPVGVAGPAFGQ